MKIFIVITLCCMVCGCANPEVSVTNRSPLYPNAVLTIELSDINGYRNFAFGQGTSGDEKIKTVGAAVIDSRNVMSATDINNEALDNQQTFRLTAIYIKSENDSDIYNITISSGFPYFEIGHSIVYGGGILNLIESEFLKVSIMDESRAQELAE